MANLPELYNATFLANPGINRATGYGVTVKLATVQPGQSYWRIVGIVHLPGNENGGNHHVYADVLDEEGRRINGAAILFINNTLTGSVKIDKPADEAGANIPMLFGDTLDVWSGNTLPSDQANGFHTRHDDEESGNTRGHHSYYVVFQRKVDGGEPDPDPIPEPTPDQLTEEIKALLEIQHHRALVQANLLRLADRLRERATAHDVSKYNFDEFEAITRIKTVARQFPFGSPEYNQALEDNLPGLNKHFERNSHHPEHYPNGVNGMGLIDLIEMVCDWKAANTLRDEVQWTKVTEAHVERFGLTAQQVRLINMIIKAIR